MLYMTTPTLPFPKLNQILVFLIRVGQKSTADRIAAYAAQAAFFILLSVFPFAMFLLQLMRFLPISQPCRHSDRRNPWKEMHKL